MKNQQGISLVSVMIAASIMGGMGLAMMRMMDNATKGSSYALAVADEINLRQELNLLVGETKHCSVSLAGDTTATPIVFKKDQIDGEDPTDGENVELYLSNVAGDTRQLRKFYPGADFGKLEIKSIKLLMDNGVGFDYPEDPSDSDIGKIRVVIDRKFGPNNSREKTIEVPLNIEFSTDSSGESTILSCKKQGSVTVEELEVETVITYRDYGGAKEYCKFKYTSDKPAECPESPEYTSSKADERDDTTCYSDAEPGLESYANSCTPNGYLIRSEAIEFHTYTTGGGRAGPRTTHNIPKKIKVDVLVLD